MTPVLVIIRPEPGASVTTDIAVQAGWSVVKAPLFSIRALPWSILDNVEYDALLAGSANIFRHGGGSLTYLAHLPVYAVGTKTAALAQEKGFAVAQTGKGGLSSLLPALKNDRIQRVLWLSGRDYVPLPKNDMHIDRIEIYASEVQAMTSTLAAALNQKAVIALHSARAAEHFRDEALHKGIDISRLSLACLAPRIAKAAGNGWAKIATAKSPDDEALLEVATQLCKT